MALVFTFGGVAPEDLVRAYVVLVFTAFVAPEILCTDRRSGMLGLYLASPLRRARQVRNEPNWLSRAPSGTTPSRAP